jgi:arylsulfatase B
MPVARAITRTTGVASAAFLCLLAMVLAWSCVPRVRGESAPKPNILLILVDDMGYGDLGCYGSREIPTPSIDALASAGVRCTQGYVSSSVCAPSRAGLMTGRYQNRFGFEHNPTYESPLPGEQIGLPKDERTIADRLKAGGYHTACIGKWHLGETAAWQRPNARGFDYFFGMLGGYHHYFPTIRKHHLYRNTEPVTCIDEPYLTDWLTTEAIDFITRVPAGEPWFVYLAYNTPHTPLEAKEEDLQRFAHIPDQTRRTYCAMQHCLDENVGRLIRHLRNTGQWDNTFIVFLSDNGGACDVNRAINAPLRGQKSTKLEGGLRVPFIFTWPATLPAGERYDQPLIALDLLPTFLAAAGLPPPQAEQQRLRNPKEKKTTRHFDGVDLLPYLRGQRGQDRPHQTLYLRRALWGAAIRHGDWKLLRLPDRAPELYDLANDISERTNLARQHPEKVAELMAKLYDWEMSLERNPMWIDDFKWMQRTRSLYDREYELLQPASAPGTNTHTRNPQAVENKNSPTADERINR